MKNTSLVMPVFLLFVSSCASPVPVAITTQQIVSSPLQPATSEPTLIPTATTATVDLGNLDKAYEDFPADVDPLPACA